MDWYRNEVDQGALQRRFQGQGGRLEAIRGDLTLAELSAKHRVDRTMIAARNRQAIDGMVGTFSGAGDAARGVSESEVEKLHAKIGQLVVERDFLLAKAIGRWAWIGGGPWSNLLTTTCRSRRSAACHVQWRNPRIRLTRRRRNPRPCAVAWFWPSLTVRQLWAPCAGDKAQRPDQKE